MARDCPKPKRESTGRSTTDTVTAQMIQSDQQPTPPASGDNPLQYLLSDSDGSDEIRQVRVHDSGSKPHCATVNVQRVPMSGIVDSGADISIMGGEMFKRVAVVAKLRKRDFKPPDKTPRNYDQQPFRLDGRLELDVSFGDKTMKTVVYVKMDTKEPLLLSEGVCRQLGIIQYHPDVVPRSSARTGERGTCVVPTVRVKLVQSVRLSPYQSVLTSACLTGCDSLHGPVLLVSHSEGRGFQVVDSVVVPNQEGQVTVMLTNTSGITERVLKDVDIGTATPAELIDSHENEHTQSLDLRDSLTGDSDTRLATEQPRAEYWVETRRVPFGEP